MQFIDVVGQDEIKSHLIKEVTSGRVSHAQMFLGPEGSGKLPLAIAFSQFLLCDHPSDTDSCGRCSNCLKIKNLTHPDLHFVYPIVISKTDKVAIADDLRPDWNQLIFRQPYFNINGWLRSNDNLGKNPIIGVDESRMIMKKLALKSYSDKFKIMVVWLPERMNVQAANKLLKVIEEPPEKTIFFLLCDQSEAILPTILSRCQIIRVPSLSQVQIAKFIASTYKVELQLAQTVANLSQGNLVSAIETVEGDQARLRHFELFVKLMRWTYAANPIELMDVSDELATLDKEKQKNFVLYGLHIFRESMVMNYLKDQLLNLHEEERQFLEKFAKYINNHNITELVEEFNATYNHIERNANPKILFTDLVIKLTKLVRKGV